MNEELYFNDELRKCLNAAGLSDCGENDAWNYWYQRVHKAHDQAVDRVTEAQRTENAKLREQMERLVTSLRVDCDIDASWDGLRRFWSIELTEGGCLMRDRARKAEADNTKLRELCAGLLTGYECGYGELCKGCTWDGLGDPKTFSCLPRVKARDLGVEVDA